jgi:hypothetical protein
LPDIGAEIAVIGLGRRLETFAVHIKQPAVKSAAQAAVFEPTVGEVGATMRTAAAEKAVTAFLVLEYHQVFAEQPHGLHRAIAGQLVDQCRRLPIAPHEVPRGRTGSGSGNEIVLLWTQHWRPSPWTMPTLYDVHA